MFENDIFQNIKFTKCYYIFYEEEKYVNFAMIFKFRVLIYFLYNVPFKEINYIIF